jgi:hypothetical protein
MKPTRRRQQRGHETLVGAYHRSKDPHDRPLKHLRRPIERDRFDRGELKALRRGSSGERHK